MQNYNIIKCTDTFFGSLSRLPAGGLVRARWMLLDPQPVVESRCSDARLHQIAALSERQHG
jgi:hypothetical protein